jgi:hypothetical protein
MDLFRPLLKREYTEARTRVNASRNSFANKTIIGEKRVLVDFHTMEINAHTRNRTPEDRRGILGLSNA